MQETKTQLIFDFGGGTLDVAIVEVGYYSLRTIAIDGDNHLGGQDLDHATSKYFIKKFREEFIEVEGREPTITPKILAKFNQAACQLKIALTGDKEASFDVYTPDFYVEDFTREEFVKICQPVFNRILEPVKRVLQQA